MKLTTKLSLAFLLSIVCFVATALVYRHNLERVTATKNWVEHTYEVIAKLEALNSVVTKTESGVRGFVATGDLSYLPQKDSASIAAEKLLHEISSLTSDNPSQQQRLARLTPIVETRLSHLDKLVEARQHSFENAQAFLNLKENLSEKLQNIVGEMKAEEFMLLDKRVKEASANVKVTEDSTIFSTTAAMFVVAFVAFLLLSEMTRNIKALTQGTYLVGGGDFSHRISVNGNDEFAALSTAFNSMSSRIESQILEQQKQDWVKSNINKLGKLSQGHRSASAFATTMLDELVPLMGAQQAALYVLDSEESAGTLRLVASYACDAEKQKAKLALGEGLLGQVARSGKKIVLKELSSDSLNIESSLVQANSVGLVIQPVPFEGAVIAVLELASLRAFSDNELTLIDEFAPWMGNVLNAIALSLTTEELLRDSQGLNDELQAQQEEMELQQDELKQANEELEHRTEELEAQNVAINEQNLALEKLRRTLELNAAELAMASKYKSEFLANMSHDLRTPLNSLLIFADLLSDNDEGNLTEEQVEFASCIRAAGKSLLALINDVLDLAKIESGKVSVDVADVSIADTIHGVEKSFRTLAEQKGLEFKVSVAPNIPVTVRTDEKRLLQILNNLLGNAMKFTSNGEVALLVYTCEKAMRGAEEEPFLSFVVKDTGIGIAAENHEKVFEPFQQAESNIKNEYGGTGLGLAICRELANLLGGSLELNSSPGEGSTFCFYLPLRRESNGNGHNKIDGPHMLAHKLVRAEEHALTTGRVEDDRATLNNGDRVLLIIEDEDSFARVLLQTARKNDFKVVVASSGAEGLQLARKYLPDGITLDLRLPDSDGWYILDQLKTSPETRHIPVHIISVETERMKGLSQGAVGFLEKPVTLATVGDAISLIKTMGEKQQAKILIVESDAILAQKFADLLQFGDDLIEMVDSGAQAIGRLNQQRYDCLVISMHLADVAGWQLAEMVQKIGKLAEVPIIIYSDHPLSDEEHERVEKLSRTNLVKDVDSPERLLHEATLFLHRVEASLPEAKRKMLNQAMAQDNNLIGRKILIVDDDERNKTALLSILAKFKMQISYACNGNEALELLKNDPKQDLVLMDIMMPYMDGYEAMRQIRLQKRFEHLPIIAVTAKAMTGDRRKCLEAGASDYITKPVDRSQLLSLLRVWLQKR